MPSKTGWCMQRFFSLVELGITTELIVCVLRHLPVENAEKTLAAMVAGGYLGRGVVRGFGISSEEMSTLPGVWGKVTNAAWIAGFRTTAHAGDEGPPAYIKAALDEL